MAGQVVVHSAGIAGEVARIRLGGLGEGGQFAGGHVSVQGFLAAEVRVHTLLAGLRGLGDALDPGAGDPGRVVDNIAAAGLALTADDLARIAEIAPDGARGGRLG